MKVSEIMSHPVITVREDATLEEVARIMLDHRFGSVPVVNEQGTMIGIITESDFAAKSKGVPFTTLRCHRSLDIGWVSQASNKCVSDSRSGHDDQRRDHSAGKRYHRRGFGVDAPLRRQPDSVLRDKVLIGIVARYDLLKLMLQERK